MNTALAAMQPITDIGLPELEALLTTVEDLAQRSMVDAMALHVARIRLFSAEADRLHADLIEKGTVAVSLGMYADFTMSTLDYRVKEIGRYARLVKSEVKDYRRIRARLEARQHHKEGNAQ